MDNLQLLWDIYIFTKPKITHPYFVSIFSKVIVAAQVILFTCLLAGHSQYGSVEGSVWYAEPQWSNY